VLLAIMLFIHKGKGLTACYMAAV